MAIRAKQVQIIFVVISPIPILMLRFQWHKTRIRIHLRPAAFGAGIAVFFTKIPLDPQRDKRT